MLHTVKISSFYFLGGSTKIENRSGVATPEIQNIQKRLIGDYPGIIMAPQDTVDRIGKHFLMDWPLVSGGRLLTVFYKDETGSRDFWNVCSFSYSEDTPGSTIKHMLSLSAEAWQELCEHEYAGTLQIDDSCKDSNADRVSLLWGDGDAYAYHFPTPKGVILNGNLSLSDMDLLHSPVRSTFEEEAGPVRPAPRTAPAEPKPQKGVFDKKRLIFPLIFVGIGFFLGSVSFSSKPSLRKEVAELQTDREYMQKQLEDRNKELVDKTQECTQKESELNDASRRYSSMEESYKGLKKKYDSDIAQRDEKIRGLEMARNKILAENDQLKEEVGRKERDNKTLRQQNEQLKTLPQQNEQLQEKIKDKSPNRGSQSRPGRSRREYAE